MGPWRRIGLFLKSDGSYFNQLEFALICSAFTLATLDQCVLCPNLLESAFTYMWYHQCRTNIFALTVVTLFININVFYSLLFLVASVIWWYISILMQYFNYRSLEALWSQTSSWIPLGPLDPLIKGPLCPPCLLHWGRVNQAHLPSDKQTDQIGEYLTLSHIRWVSVRIRWSKKHWKRTNRFLE